MESPFQIGCMFDEPPTIGMPSRSRTCPGIACPSENPQAPITCWS